jgi:nucleoside-diphosphate-sugar epimerase
MKILLLGANGYLGSKLVQKLDQKYDTDCVDLCLFGVNITNSIVTNYNNIDITGYDIVVCLAGHSSVQMCEHSPRRSWINNVEYFRELCNKIRPNQKLIYASSASVYGNRDHECVEDSPINYSVISNYDLQKITIDLIAAKAISEGKNLIGLRFGTINGISPNTRYELMLNSMVKTALEKKLVNIKNKKMRRAVLGIDDATDAILGFIESSSPSGYYNICSFNSSVEEMAEYVAKALNVNIVDGGEDPKYYNFVLDTSKIRSIGYYPKQSIKTLVDELIQGYDSVYCDNRVTDKNFAEYL